MEIMEIYEKDFIYIYDNIVLLIVERTRNNNIIPLW